MNKAKAILSVVLAAGLVISAAGMTSHAISNISDSEARPKTETVFTSAPIETESSSLSALWAW